MPNTLKTVKVGERSPTQPITSTRPSSTCLRCNLHNNATCTIHHRASASLQARVRNPNQTCFHVMQAARSRHVSRADLPPSVLWRNRQTEACLVLKIKQRNRCGDFQTQITKPKLPVLRPNREKLLPLVLRPNQRKTS
jgi:hypothetical protein